MLEFVRNWSPRNKRFLTIGLALTISAQILVLATEYLSSVWPLWFGKSVILETAPVDPRSLFRGNYVRLNYVISTIDKALTREHFKRGEVGYVTLKEEGEFFIATGLHRERPKSGIYIRGRVTGVSGDYRMKYGIEAFFMPKKKALATERTVRQGANAEVYLLSSGKAAIAKLNIEPQAKGEPRRLTEQNAIPNTE